MIMADPRSDVQDRTPDLWERELISHEQAALLLAKSLLHGLIARLVISLKVAVEYVGTAIAVGHEMVAICGNAPEAPDKTLGQLATIGASSHVTSHNGARISCRAFMLVATSSIWSERPLRLRAPS